MKALRLPLKLLVLGALVGAFFAASPAYAAYKARVDGGTLKIVGDGASDKLALAATPDTLVLDVGEDGTSDFSFDRNTFTAIDVQAGGGDDEVRVLNSSTPLAQSITINGGAGDDVLLGGNGAETFVGGSGDDFVDGNIGADTAQLGSGNDTFQWDPGDGSDVVEGQGGNDTLEFNGSNIGENIDVSANGSRVRLARNVASIVMDLNGIERLNVHALGGADNIVVDDLAGTGVKTVDADLNGFGGGGTDGAADTVTAVGTDGADRVSVSAPGCFATVSGLAAQVLVEGADSTQDNVNIDTLGGDDTVTSGREVCGPEAINVDGGAGNDVARYRGTDVADTIGIARNGSEVSTFADLSSRLDIAAVESLVVQGLGGNDLIAGQNGIGGLTSLTIDGGDGDDDLRGGDGADLLLGGPGNDHLDGNIGADTAQLGPGDDHFSWDPGDGSDTVEGQGGNDTLDFNGSNIGEKIELSANGPRLRLTRDVAAITMDTNGIDAVNLRALGGADTITVNDLAGTDVKNVNVDLTGFDGNGDAAADAVVVTGTDKRDVVQVSRSGPQVAVAGLAAQTRIVGSEPAADALKIQTLGGNDDVTVAPDVADVIATIVDLGADE